jgi:hypothetical protein
LRSGNLFFSKIIQNYLLGTVEMSEVAAVPVKQGFKANQSMIMGRVDRLGSFESNGKRIHETLIAIPAPDPYSMPGKVVVQSTNRCGQVGDDVKLLVEVSGFPTSFTNKSGEVTQTARNVLRLVE